VIANLAGEALQDLTKQMRHWSLIRMLCCPDRSPRNISSRLPEGMRESSRVRALFNILSLRLATFWISAEKRRSPSPDQILSASFPRKLLIIAQL